MGLYITVCGAQHTVFVFYPVGAGDAYCERNTRHDELVHVVQGRLYRIFTH